MKKISASICIFIFTLLVSCSTQDPVLKKGELTRIDVQRLFPFETYGEASMITKPESIELLKEVFDSVKWEPNTDVKLSRGPDVKATLFYLYDKNMPERLYEYRIWFNKEMATIISDSRKEGYGELDKDHSAILKAEMLSILEKE
jgi:hypothetical protein